MHPIKLDINNNNKEDLVELVYGNKNLYLKSPRVMHLLDEDVINTEDGKLIDYQALPMADWALIFSLLAPSSFRLIPKVSSKVLCHGIFLMMVRVFSCKNTCLKLHPPHGMLQDI